VWIRSPTTGLIIITVIIIYTRISRNEFGLFDLHIYERTYVSDCFVGPKRLMFDDRAEMSRKQNHRSETHGVKRRVYGKLIFVVHFLPAFPRRDFFPGFGINHDRFERVSYVFYLFSSRPTTIYFFHTFDSTNKPTRLNNVGCYEIHIFFLYTCVRNTC